MSMSKDDKSEFLSALDQLFAKYFEEKESYGRERTVQDKFWGTYLRAMKDEDVARPKDWDGNTGSILTFTGLFAATVAAFVIESYKSLSRDAGDQTVVLLTQLLAATTNSSSSRATTIASSDDFHSPFPAVLANALWFISLVVALACALLATLVQQWSRDYVRDIKQRDTLDEPIVSRALNHVYIRMGVDRYGMDGVVNLIVSLVHLAVILFAAGLLLFLFPINAVVSWCTMFALSIFGLAYLVAGVLPIVDSSCPYRTPLTYPLILGYVGCVYVSDMYLWQLLPMYGFYQALEWGREIYSHLGVVFRLRWVKKWFLMIPMRVLLAWRPIQQLFMPIYSRKGEQPGKRRKPLELSTFMTNLRFDFLWRHTSRQLIPAGDDSLHILLQSAYEIMGSTSDGDACIDHLLEDGRLGTKLREAHASHAEPDTRISILQMTCLLLRQCYRRLGMNVPPPAYYLTNFFSTIGSVYGVHDDASFVLRARMCLFHLRWSLLLLHRERNTTADSIGFSITEFNEIYFSKKARTSNDLRSLLYLREHLEYPMALITLSNSWQYNVIDMSSELRAARGDWITDTTSCLVPLHDGACCRQRDGPFEHVVACAVLTMIVHLLRASDADREELRRSHLHPYNSGPWNHDVQFDRWDLVSGMSRDDRRRAPSREFLSILREAGLGRWLEYNNLSYLPPTDTPQGRLLTSYPFVYALRNLAGHVDMTLARSGALHSFPSSPSAPATRGDTAPALNKDGHTMSVLSESSNSPDAHNVIETVHFNDTVNVPIRSDGSPALEQVVVDNDSSRQIASDRRLHRDRKVECDESEQEGEAEKRETGGELKTRE